MPRVLSAMNRDNKQVVIVGAGIGGLSAAIHLATAGQRVIVLEQNPQVGGKMGQVAVAGFRWDTGPSVITMRAVFDELFAVAGRRLEDYLTLRRLEPLTRYFYRDGVVLDLWADWPKLAAQIAAIDERDVAGYLRCLSYAASLYRITGPVFIHDRPPTLNSFTHVPIRDMLRIEPWLTMDQAIRRYVRSPHLRQLFGRFATYAGASPFRAPATLNVIAHVELTGGVWYPKGGVYTISMAMRKLAEELGVEIRVNTRVAQLLVQRQRVTGVLLDSGETLAAAAVIANVDVTRVYRQLLPSGVVPRGLSARMAKLAPSCSGFALLLGIKGEHPRLAHHNVFFSRDYRLEFQQIFDQGIPPTEPTVYVAITSKSDPEHAPPGHENWFVLVNVPPLGATFDRERQAQAYQETVFATLAQFGLEIRDQIVTQQVISPRQLAATTGAWRGALYGSSSNAALNAFRRPHNRDPHVKGLYFAGGTTHPGGGVPLVTLSGKVAASLLLEEWA